MCLFKTNDRTIQTKQDNLDYANSCLSMHSVCETDREQGTVLLIRSRKTLCNLCDLNSSSSILN